jgi:hypothetical protein
MRTVRDIEAYLGSMNRRYSTVDGHEGMYLVQSSERMPPIALRIVAPLVVFRVYIGDAPRPGEGSDHVPLYRKLLELNAGSLVHTSFGLEGEQIVLCSALELENLDYNELEATLEELDLTLVQQVPVLAQLSKKN